MLTCIEHIGSKLYFLQMYLSTKMSFIGKPQNIMLKITDSTVFASIFNLYYLNLFVKI